MAMALPIAFPRSRSDLVAGSLLTKVGRRNSWLIHRASSGPACWLRYPARNVAENTTRAFGSTLVEVRPPSRSAQRLGSAPPWSCRHLYRGAASRIVWTGSWRLIIVTETRNDVQALPPQIRLGGLPTWRASPHSRSFRRAEGGRGQYQPLSRRIAQLEHGEDFLSSRTLQLREVAVVSGDRAVPAGCFAVTEKKQPGQDRIQKRRALRDRRRWSPRQDVEFLDPVVCADEQRRQVQRTWPTRRSKEPEQGAPDRHGL